MRLATARDELEPLRDPTVTGPDDPRLTILVLTRVVDRLGDLELVTSHEIEDLFAVDLAYLQDFYGVINFGSQEEYDELIRSQQESTLLGGDPSRRIAAGRAAHRARPTTCRGWTGRRRRRNRRGSRRERPPVRAAVEELLGARTF